MNSFKVVQLKYRKLSKKDLLKTIKKAEWEETEEFQASSAEEAAEVIAYDFWNSGDDHEMLFAVKEEGKGPVIIEVFVNLEPEFNAYKYRFSGDK